MHSDYDSAIQVSFQPAAARPMSPEYSSLPGETIGGPKQEEDDHCSEGPTGSPANLGYDMVSSYNVWHSGFQPIVFESEVYESLIFSVLGNVQEARLLMEMAISNCKSLFGYKIKPNYSHWVLRIQRHVTIGVHFGIVWIAHAQHQWQSATWYHPVVKPWLLGQIPLDLHHGLSALVGL